jgi:predicted HicB family RNase H-like nuclease
MKPTSDKYIKRRVRGESFQLRIEPKVKAQCKLAAKKLNSSLNKLGEAALIFYIEALKKDGAL